MRFVVETAVFPEPMSEPDFRLLEECRIPSIELCCLRHRFDYLDAGYLATMLPLLASMSFKITSMHLPFGAHLDPSSLDDTVREAALAHVKRAIEIGLELGCEVLVLHPGHNAGDDEDRRLRFERSRQAIRELAACLPKDGRAKLAVENLIPPMIGQSLDELCSIVEAVHDERVGYCIDTGHAFLTDPLEEVVRRCGKRIFNFHLADNDGLEDRHWMPLEGQIDWAAFKRSLEEIGYDGLLTYELTNRPETATVLGEMKQNFAALWPSGAV